MMKEPRVVTFSVQVIQTVDKDGNATEKVKIGIGTQPQTDKGILTDRVYGMDIPDATARITEYATLFGPEVAQEAGADAVAMTDIIKRFGLRELEARKMLTKG
jgi:hypothetical protein